MKIDNKVGVKLDGSEVIDFVIEDHRKHHKKVYRLLCNCGDYFNIREISVIL